MICNVAFFCSGHFASPTCAKPRTNILVPSNDVGRKRGGGMGAGVWGRVSVGARGRGGGWAKRAVQQSFFSDFT